MENRTPSSSDPSQPDKKQIKKPRLFCTFQKQNEVFGNLMHSMQNVRSGGFCPPDPPSKKWGIAPNVVCWCMPKTLKVMASAYVLLSVENLKLCHQTIPSQKNRKMKHQVLQILTHPSTKKVYQGSILSLGKGSCWVNVGCRSCESHACQCARCNCVQKKGGAWHQRWCAGECPNLESEG